MKKLLLLFTCATLSLTGFGQSAMYNQWDKKVLEKANTAKDLTWMSAEEKRVVFLCNLARMNPSLFAATILQHFMDSTGYKNSAYVVSLKKTLNSAKPTDPFTPQQDLHAIVKDFADKMGKAGKKGHEGFEKRYAPVKKKYNQFIGENCSYGHDNALRIVMQLLIDEGIGDAGHRKNILDPKFKNIGVVIGPHRTSTSQCVMAFGG
jgi:uncharacterized protein YkwD